jgi:hypothetical protein
MRNVAELTIEDADADEVFDDSSITPLSESVSNEEAKILLT